MSESQEQPRAAGADRRIHACRACGGPLAASFVDLGLMPIANRLLDRDRLGEREPRHPLHVRVCGDCLLVQHDTEVSPAALFTDYTYLSSTSGAWVEHARRFVDAAIRRFDLGPASRVIEIASNDGYLLRHFVERDVPALGIEPAANVAAIARSRGVPTEARFFSAAAALDLAGRGLSADLVVANNVIAHVPAIGDFLAGVRRLLKPGGVFTAEFPHLLELIRNGQFDTIYHEHFFYWSLQALEPALARAGLTLVDLERLPTHGGSLRIAAMANGQPLPEAGPALGLVRAEEAAAGLDRADGYSGFDAKATAVKAGLVRFLADARAAGRRVAAFGAAAKGVTLLNYCGIGADAVAFVADESPTKIGRWLPGCRIPVVAMDRIREERPDYVLVLPWNHAAEIMAKLAAIREWGGAFVLPVPETRLVR